MEQIQNLNQSQLNRSQLTDNMDSDMEFHEIEDFQDYSKYEAEEMTKEEYKQAYNWIKMTYPNLREYQIQAIALFSIENYGIINIFCGMGKSYMIPTILDYQKKQRECKVMLCVFPANLVEQFQEDLNMQQIDLGEILILNGDNNVKSIKRLKQIFKDDPFEEDLSIIQKSDEFSQILSELDSDQSVLSDERPDVLVISTYNSVNKIKDMYDMFDFVLLDECHHAFAPTTIFLQDRQENIVKLSASLHKQEQLENIRYYFPLRKAIELGYLCDYQIICKIFEKKDGQEYRYKDVIEYLCEFMEREFQNSKITKYKCKRAIGYCRNVQSSKANKSNLEEMKDYDGDWMKVKVIRGVDKDKGQLFDWLREETDDKRCLMSVNTLKEGIDIKNADTILFFEHKSSFQDIVQCVGRCMRPFKNKKMAYIIIPLLLSKEEIELFNNDAINKLIKTEFKKLINIVDNLRKIDSAITEENMYQKVQFECTFCPDEYVEKMIKKISQGSGFGGFKEKLQMMDDWIQQNGRRFTQSAKDPLEKKITSFYGNCQQNHKGNKKSMSIQENRLLFEQFKDKYKHILEDKFEFKVQQMDDWIQQNGRKFNQRAKDPLEKKITTFYGTCQNNHKGNKQSMSIQENRLLFEQFNDKHKKYFPNFKKVEFKEQEVKESHHLIKWRKDKYPIIKEYLQTNNKYPSSKEKLYPILNTSIKNYNSNSPYIDRQLFNELIDQFPFLKSKVANPDQSQLEESKQDIQQVYQIEESKQDTQQVYQIEESKQDIQQVYQIEESKQDTQDLKDRNSDQRSLQQIQQIQQIQQPDQLKIQQEKTQQQILQKEIKLLNLLSSQRITFEQYIQYMLN